MSAAPWAAHFGLSRTPFGKSIPARDLFARQAHAQATARISFCITETLLGVITGDVGAGKTVAVRAATAALDPSRHVFIYLANPTIGVRGMLTHIYQDGRLGSIQPIGAAPDQFKPSSSYVYGVGAFLLAGSELAQMTK